MAELTAADVTALLCRECPRLAAERVRPLRTSGTEHLVFRVGDRHLARFPRDADAAQSLSKELSWLPRLAERLPLALPEIVHFSNSCDAFEWPWLVTRWLDGEDASGVVRQGDIPTSWAGVLADLVLALRAIDLEDVPRSQWPSGGRGGPLEERVRSLTAMTDPLAGRPEVSRLDSLLASALAIQPPQSPPVLLHGDLIPGNLVVRDGRLVGLLDLGTLTTGSPAWDLTPAWWVLDARGRAVFRDRLDVDDATWAWGRAFAATQGLLADWFYRPRDHALAPLGARAVGEALGDFIGGADSGR